MSHCHVDHLMFSNKKSQQLRINMKAFTITFLFLSFTFCLGEIAEEDKIKAGHYQQWRAKIPLVKKNDESYKPDCHVECIKRCGSDHKGVSVCGSMFEYADDPLKDEVCFLLISPNEIIHKVARFWPKLRDLIYLKS